VTAGSTTFFSDSKRKFQKHEVQRRKLDKRDRKLLKLQERVEARRLELRTKPTNEESQNQS
jgi:hypothetical protein